MPIWLYFHEFPVGMLCRGQQRFEPRFLVPRQQAGGEYASGRAARSTGRRLCNPGCELLMHGDIVQIAEAILQVFQNGEKTLAMLFDLLSRKHRFVKLRGVPQFFGLDPKLVPRAGIEFCQLSASFPDFLPAARELLTRLDFNRLLATLAQ